MSQQNNSNNTNDASPSRGSAVSRPDLHLQAGLHTCAGERLPASEGTNLQFEVDARKDQEQKLQKILLECERLRDSEKEMVIALARSVQAVEDEKDRTKQFLVAAEDTAAELDRLRLQNAASERHIKDLKEQLKGIAFGHGPADSEPAGSMPSTLRYRPIPSPVDESSASALDGPGDSVPAPPDADNLPQFLRRRVHSAPSSPSPAVVEQRLRDYCRPRSMSCPEFSGYDLWTPAMYADLDANGDSAEYLDFAGYCAFVEVLRVGCSHSPGLSRASGELYGQPGSYSPVQGFGPHNAGIFHGPGCYCHAFMYSSSPSTSLPSPTQQSDRELLEPRQFIELFLPRRLTH